MASAAAPKNSRLLNTIFFVSDQDFESLELLEELAGAGADDEDDPESDFELSFLEPSDLDSDFVSDFCPSDLEPSDCPPSFLPCEFDVPEPFA